MTTWLHRSEILTAPVKTHSRLASSAFVPRSGVWNYIMLCNAHPPLPNHHHLLSVKNLCFIRIIRAVRRVSTRINNTDTHLVKHISQYGLKVEPCNYVTSWGGRRAMGREGASERARGACGLTNEYPGGFSLIVGEELKVWWVRTTFKLSFMCDTSLPLWADIKTVWSRAQKNKQAALDSDYRFESIGIRVQKGKNRTLIP